ncbi:MAG: hypothetical protein ACRCSE_01685 [Vibrio sp.]
MSAVLILLILVSGFVFTTLHIPARFKQKRTTGWDSYFYVVAWGTLWGFLAAIICVLIDFFNGVAWVVERLGFRLHDVSTLAIKFDDIRLIAFAFVSVLLAFACGMISKVYFALCPDKKLKHIAKIAKNDHLDAFILESSVTQMPILITLGSRKSYVGICFGEAGFDDGGSEHVSLLPLLSGYRDKDKLSLNIVTNYHIHYEDNNIYSGDNGDLTLDHFKVIIPKSEVEVYSFFDITTFKKFKEVEKICDMAGSDNEIGIPNSEYNAKSVRDGYLGFNSTSGG